MFSYIVYIHTQILTHAYIRTFVIYIYGIYTYTYYKNAFDVLFYASVFCFTAPAAFGGQVWVQYGLYSYIHIRSIVFSWPYLLYFFGGRFGGLLVLGGTVADAGSADGN